MVALDQVLAAALVEGPVTDLGPVTPFTFPEPTGPDRLPELAVAHDRFRLACADATAWLDDETVDLDAVGHFHLGGDAGPFEAGRLATAAAGLAVVLDDGTDADDAALGFREVDPEIGEIAPGARQVGGALDTGGGVVLRKAGGLSPSLAALHRDLTAATHDRVEVFVTIGNVATRKVLRPAASATVVVLAGAGAVRSADDPPLAVRAGDVVATGAPPRTTGPGLVCVVITRERPTAYDLRKFLLRRCTCHPLLRVDLPSDLTARRPVYGLDDPPPFGELIRDEVTQVVEAASAPGVFDAWWRSRLTSPRAPVVGGSMDHAVVGRFVGGFGVLAESDDGLVLAAGGRTFAVARQVLGTLAALAAGERRVLADDPSAEALARVLVPHALVDVVPVAGPS